MPLYRTHAPMSMVPGASGGRFARLCAMTNHRLPAILAALAAAIPAPSAFAAVAISADAAVPIIYGYKAEGLYHGSWALSDLAPLFEAPEGGPTSQGYRLDEGALRHRGWHVWGAQGPLTVAAARAAFAGAGVTLDGAATPVDVLWTDGLQAFQDAGPAPWLPTWLAGKVNPEAHPRLKRGATWRAKGADGRALMVYAEEGAAPPAQALRDARSWQWEAIAHGQAKNGERLSTYHAVPRSFGGVALQALAGRWQHEGDALRVEAGNLVDDSTSPDAAIALPDTLAAIGQMGVDALVPFDFELRLPHDAQVKLAAAVPLIAANLKGPEDVPVQPFVIKEKQGRKIAIIGLVDTQHVKHYSLYEADHGWETEDPFTALPRVLKAVKLQKPDAIVLVTNLEEAELPRLRDMASGVTAIVTRYQTRGEWDYKERFESGQRNARTDLLPWLMVGGSKDQAGKLTLGFGARDGKQGLRWIENEVRRAVGDQEADPAPERTWAFRDRLAAWQAQRQDAVLPDRRRLATVDPRLARPDGRPAPQYDRQAWSRIAAGALRRAAGTEIAILHVVRNAPISDGEVPRHVADQWLKQEKVVLVQMRGAQIRKLLERDGVKAPFATAGWHPSHDMAGGRALADDEHYSVVTTESIARSENAGDDFEGEPFDGLKRLGPRVVRGGDGVGIGDATMGVLEDLKRKHGGFGEGYLAELGGLMLDDGNSFDSRWRILVRHNELTFQRFTASARDTFDKVRNAEINNPDSTFYGAKVDVAALHEADWLDWENRAILRYLRADVVEAPGAAAAAAAAAVPAADAKAPAAGAEAPAAATPDTSAEPPDAAEQDDLIQLTSEMRIKALTIPTGRDDMALLPYVAGNYLTEFTPSFDDAGIANPRRQELNAHTGLVLRTETLLRELRFGVIGKNDLAATVGRFEPGLQLAAIIEQPVGPAIFQLNGDLRRFLAMPEDGPEDLAWLNRVGAALRFPLGGGLNLSIGADALLFFGKLPETSSWGNTFTPTIGITYNGVWKPAYGIMYDPGDSLDEDQEDEGGN